MKANRKFLIVSALILTVAVAAHGGVSGVSFGQPRVIVPAPTETARQHLAWPKVVRTANGKLVVACVSASKHAGNAGGLEAVAVSADDGATFSALNVLAKPEGDSKWTEGGNLALGASGNRVVMLSMTYASDNSTSGIYGRISDDGGATWSVTDTSGISPDKTGSVFGHVISIPGRGLTAFGHYRPPAREPIGGIWMASSSDNGATWGAPTCILDRDEFVEPDFVYSQGRIIGLIRQDLGNGTTLNGYWQITSDDGGTTWSEPVVVMAGSEGCQSAAPCIVEDAQNPGRLYAVQTVLRGQHGSASSSGEIVVWTAEAATLNWKRIGTVASFSGIEDFGYASVAQIGGDEWFVVFYAGALNGANSIYGVRCAFDVTQTLRTRGAKLENGNLSMSADCLIDGRLYLASGATDGGSKLEAWDNLTQLQDVAAGEQINIDMPLPDGAAFARVVLRETIQQKTVTTNAIPYLEGDGGQYLEITNHTLKSTDRIVAQVMGLRDVVETSNQCGIFGSRLGSSSKNISALWAKAAGGPFYSAGEGSIICDFNNNNYETYRQDWNGLSLNARYTVELSAAKRSVAQNGQEIAPRNGNKGACADAAFETDTNCQLFNIPNRPGSYAHCFVGRFYSFKIYEAGGVSPVRDLVPFVDETDGKAKMKDLETGALYTNLGTGDFKYGEDLDVTEDVTVVEGPALAWGPCVATNAVPSGSVEPIAGYPEYGTTCLALPIGSNISVDSSATFATLGVTTAYTYAFSIKNPSAQTSQFGYYYGHIMGAGATNTKPVQKGAPLIYKTNGTTGEKSIELQAWTSSGNAQCLTILGYMTANTSWEAKKAQEVLALEDGEWHNVVFTYDATAQHAQVFVDGIKVHDITSANLAEYLNYDSTGSTSTFATPSTDGIFCLGRNIDKNDNFAGSLSNVSVWNRALTTEEAAAISGVRLMGNETGLVLYWPLDGETGDVTALDRQVNTSAHDGAVYTTGFTPCGTSWEEMGPHGPMIPFPARQIMASYADKSALIVSVSGGAAANVYLATGAKKGGSNPAKWDKLTFVAALQAGSTGLAYSIPIPTGTRYAQVFLGTGPIAGDLSTIKVLSVGDCVSVAPAGLLIFVR